MATRQSRGKSKTGGMGSGPGCLLALGLILLLIGILLFNKDKLIRIFSGTPVGEKLLTTKNAPASGPEKTGASLQVKPAQPGPEKQKPPATEAPRQEPAKPSAPEKKPADSAVKPGAEKNTPARTPVAPEPVKAPSSTVKAPAGKAPEKPAATKSVQDKPGETPPKTPVPVKSPALKTPESKVPVEKPVNQRERALWFVRIGSDGTLSRVRVTRLFPVSDNPLIDVLNALMEGTLESEEKKGCQSLIPSRCRLLSATVRDSTAWLNFNEAFQFNSYGVEGLMAQIRQIVYTATEFDSVKDVQLMIEGKVMDYLGAEGIFIGRPLTRESL